MNGKTCSREGFSGKVYCQLINELCSLKIESAYCKEEEFILILNKNSNKFTEVALILKR